MIFFQAIIGAIVSAPMNPVIASSMFFLSYARPIKFWEKNYKYVFILMTVTINLLVCGHSTKRQDTTNTRLDQTLDGNMKSKWFLSFQLTR